MHIYQLPLSLYSFKLRLAIALKGLSIELREPPERSYRSEAFRAINPAGTIPVLVDGDLVLPESDAIIEYLEAVHPEPSLMPRSPKQQARVRMLSRWNDLQLEPAIRRLFSQIEPAKRDRALVDAADAVIMEKLAMIENALDSTGPYSLADTPNMADCGLAATLVWLDALAVPLALKARPGAKQKRLLAAMAAHPKLAAEFGVYATLLESWIHARLA